MIGALLGRLLRRAAVRYSGSDIPIEPIRWGVFNRYPGNGHAIVVLYRAPDGTVTRDGCWWMPDNPNHAAEPRQFMRLNLGALAEGLVERVHGEPPK